VRDADDEADHHAKFLRAITWRASLNKLPPRGTAERDALEVHVALLAQECPRATPTQLAAQTGLPLPKVGTAVETLEGKGQVRVYRGVSAHPFRAVELTEAGRRGL
jgi:hypothetical protein